MPAGDKWRPELMPDGEMAGGEGTRRQPGAGIWRSRRRRNGIIIAPAGTRGLLRVAKRPAEMAAAAAAAAAAERMECGLAEI